MIYSEVVSPLNALSTEQVVFATNVQTAIGGTEMKEIEIAAVLNLQLVEQEAADIQLGRSRGAQT